MTWRNITVRIQQLSWRPRVALIGILVLVVTSARADDLDRVIDFKIDAQPLDAALIEFSEQSNVQLMVATELVAGLESPGVTGRISIAEALAELIGNNELTFNAVSENTIALLGADEVFSPRSDASVSGQSANVDPIDQLKRTEPAGPVRVSNSPSPANFVDLTEEIVVTGTRGKPRSVVGSPAPIDNISAAALEQTGRPGLFEALEYLVPSFHLPARAGGSTSTVIATGGLRGLNPDQALVLINGKRRHTTALINAVAALYNGSVPADLDHIPIAAVKRIEILRDGAAAQYGSDAIAGVINIILKDQYEGGRLSITAGQNFDRGDGKSLQASADIGFPLGDSGFLHLAIEGEDQGSSNRAVPIDPDIQLYYPSSDGSPDPRESTANRLVTKNYGAMPSDTIRIAYNAGWTLPIDIGLYSFATYSVRKSNLNWTYREPNDPNNIDSIYPDGFRPKSLIDETDYEVAFGGQGKWSGWQWDATTLYGQNKADRETRETLNASLGPTSPTEFYIGQLKSADWVNTLDVTRAFGIGTGELQVSWGLQYHREFYRITEGDPASYAAGTFVFPSDHPRAGETPAPAAQASHGIRPEDTSNKRRSSVALYGELGWSPSDRLFAGIAVRYENYDDTAGDTLVAKLTGRYAISGRLALRATASTGFRVPPMAQQQHASSTSQFRDLDGDGSLELLLIKQLPPESAAAIALGAVPLGPEESVNLSAGFTFEPIDSFIVTVDAYRIELNDRISITSTLSGPEVTAILVANGLSSSLSGQYYTNAIDTTTTGIDVVGSYSVDLGSAGSVAFNLGFNSNDTDIDRIAPNPPALDDLGPGFVLFDRTRQGNLTYGFPEYKGVFGINWQWRMLNTNLRLVRFGGYRTTNNNPASEKDVEAENVVDLDLTYQIGDHVSATVGASNVFNTYPTQILPPDPIRGSGQYSTRGGFGFTGGSYYARFNLTF